VPRHDELAVLLRSARQLAKLCRDGAALLAEAREHQADPAVMAAARKMASTLLRTKHEAEDVLVAFVLDCSRCGRRVHWGPGRGGASSVTGRTRSPRRTITLRGCGGESPDWDSWRCDWRWV
jgi:hypothetical protein